jgi:uncharacterized protein (DUF433 family)
MLAGRKMNVRFIFGIALTTLCHNGVEVEDIALPRMDLDTLRRTPAYPFGEAAHYLGLPTSTLRSWCVGQGYLSTKGKPMRFRHVIDLDGAPSEGLSFLNMVEAHVLTAIRRSYGVALPKIRDSLEFVALKLQIRRPLASAVFQTNGVDLFVEEFGSLLNVTKDGQVEIADMMRAHLRRVKFDAHGIPIKLYPFTRKNVSPIDAAPSPVEMDPRIAFGRPVLVGRSVPTAVLADRFKAGDTLSELAADYDTSTDKIEEAIRCELDRREAA